MHLKTTFQSWKIKTWIFYSIKSKFKIHWTVYNGIMKNEKPFHRKFFNFYLLVKQLNAETLSTITNNLEITSHRQPVSTYKNNNENTEPQKYMRTVSSSAHANSASNYIVNVNSNQTSTTNFNSNAHTHVPGRFVRLTVSFFCLENACNFVSTYGYARIV